MDLKQTAQLFGYYFCIASALGTVGTVGAVAAFAQSTTEFELLDESARMEAYDLQVDGQVIGGSKAQKGDWPATLVFKSSVAKGCTATVVGRRTVLTAAHCVADGQSGTLSAGSSKVRLTCYQHEKYRAGVRSADYALCLSESKLPSLGMGFERINIDASATALKKDGRLWLLGYGCKTDRVESDLKNLFEGYSTIADISSSMGHLWIRTVGHAVICPGDSGGGAYWVESADNIKGRRLLVAVNSASYTQSKQSFLSNTATSEFIDWAKDVVNKAIEKARNENKDPNIAICGVVGSEDNCRN